MNFTDKMLEHGLSHCKIGNDTISHRSNGHNIARCPSQHALCFQPHRQHFVFGSFIGSNRHHGRLT